MKKIAFIFLTALVITSCNQNKKDQTTENTVEQTEQKQHERIVSLNGSISEILVDLGETENIVGVDVTSTFPENLKETAKDLGHTSKISIESLMSLQPTVIYFTEKELSDDLQAQLQKSGIRLEKLTQEFTVEGAKNMIKSVANSLHNNNYQPLIDKIDEDISNLHSLEKKPKVLFIYARGASMLLVAGDETPANSIINLAVGQNAVTEFKDFKPLTPESLLNSNPDYILMFTTGLQSMGGVDGVLKIEGIEKTNAGKNKRIIAMDGQLLTGFSPRLGLAVKELNHLLSK
jgi:iron complex transport system substrate-binding protein